ncbi:caspase domain-containing protein [Chytriomyces sp. MP71]|nr:caspase domain-containing protein [Chytriomyces sp. MP71]
MEGLLGNILGAIAHPPGAPQHNQNQQAYGTPGQQPAHVQQQQQQAHQPHHQTAPQQQQIQQHQRVQGGRGNKKALIIGINYTGSKHQLSGCINDAHNIRSFLNQNYGYPTDPNSMIVMTDDARDPAMRPTAKNLLAGFHWLVAGARPGDQLFMSYSGHGGQIPDQDGDRANGMDDTICPVDFETAGQISSDHLHQYLVKALPPNVKFNVILDCCHSGTLLELPFTYRPDANGKMSPVDLVKGGMKLASEAASVLRGGFSMGKINDYKRLFEEARVLAGSLRGEQTPNVDQNGYKQEQFLENDNVPRQIICVSGCKDEQTSADTSFDGRASGALTYALLTTLRQTPQLSMEQLLVSLRGFMQGKFSQVPQLSTGMQVDPSTPFTL